MVHSKCDVAIAYEGSDGEAVNRGCLEGLESLGGLAI